MNKEFISVQGQQYETLNEVFAKLESIQILLDMRKTKELLDEADAQYAEAYDNQKGQHELFISTTDTEKVIMLSYDDRMKFVSASISTTNFDLIVSAYISATLACGQFGHIQVHRGAWSIVL